MARSYCDDQLVSELAVAAGFYRGQAEVMQAAIKRFVANPDNYATRIELESLARRDMDAEIEDMMARHAPKKLEVV